MTIRDILTNIRERLQKAGIEDFEYESWVLLCSQPDRRSSGKGS